MSRYDRGQDHVGGGSDFCSAAKAEAAGIMAVFPKNIADPQQLKPYGRYVKAGNAKLVALVPPELSADLAVITKVSYSIADSYIAGKQLGVTVLKEAADPKFLAATKHPGGLCQVALRNRGFP